MILRFRGDYEWFIITVILTASYLKNIVVVLVLPCHRVVGTNGSLTGYAGGIDKKIALLELEHTDMSGFFVPKKGTAL